MIFTSCNALRGASLTRIGYNPSSVSGALIVLKAHSPTGPLGLYPSHIRKRNLVQQIRVEILMFTCHLFFKPTQMAKVSYFFIYIIIIIYIYIYIFQISNIEIDKFWAELPPFPNYQMSVLKWFLKLNDWPKIAWQKRGDNLTYKIWESSTTKYLLNSC